MPEEDHLTVQEERTQYGEEKPKAKDTARLIWASKPKKEPNAKDLEFQTAEEVYPNIADVKDKKLSRFWAETKDINDDPNRLIWGDNLLVMQALLANGYEGQIDLIYIDPPFNTGENFNFYNEIKIGNTTFDKELPISERLAYTDTWERGIDSFLDMLYPRLQLMRKLLSERGFIFVHMGSEMSSHVKVMMDEIFGLHNFRNKIVVEKSMGKNYIEGETINIFNSMYDEILVYAKNPSAKIKKSFYDLNDLLKNLEYIDSISALNKIAQFGKKNKIALEDAGGKYYWGPFDAPGVRKYLSYELFKHKPPVGRHWSWTEDRTKRAVERYLECEKLKQNIKDHILLGEKLRELADDGVLFNPNNGGPRCKKYIDNLRILGDLWPDVGVNDRSILYPTAKSQELIKRIIEICSEENSLIADFFCGSGSTVIAAESLKRKWITSDLSKASIQLSRSRLVEENSKPFLIQNLGNYQRQLIYSKEIKLKEMYNIVLKLFGATPRTDWHGFGISKEDNKTLVFVCEPDRPMTGKKAVELAKSAKTADGKGYKRLIILAWDFEYDFDDTFQRLTKNSKRELADIEFKIIPSDVYKYLRSTKVGDQDLANKITFYEKPYLRLSEPQIAKRDKEEAQIKLKIEQYVLRDIPVKDESKRPEIEKMLHKNFANLIDYWTVDWDYDGEVFRSKWQAIRDRKSANPVSTTADTTLKRGKKYMIAVRVVDVFGNDASLTKEIDLR